jgi:hypothetical protein
VLANCVAVPLCTVVASFLRADSEHVVGSVRDFGGVVAIGNTGLHRKRTHSDFDCLRRGVGDCPVAEEPPSSLRYA